MELLQIEGKKALGEMLEPWTQIFNDPVIGLLEGRAPGSICKAGKENCRMKRARVMPVLLIGRPCADVHALRKKE
ncbi:hypothetical protein AX768_10995 [Burkholderia sp. PAMC 28687]|uniref:hypothetical protein n=1 Tax=Burkholderiaceae TaxID=119060 RepID=UPI0007859E2D|nr:MULTISPECIES: hypothetical protein [Burkholderiaceae]AMM14550.1 hypothetical protein AX768_10995 [Burkholderia sp. PAMC 28687]